MDNEHDLLRLIAEGNEAAFKQLFYTYNKRLFTFAEGMMKSAADAEEIVQEAFAKLWSARSGLTAVDKPGQYLYRMVRNRCIDHLRRMGREKYLTDEAWANISQPDHSLEEMLRGREFQELIEKALQELPAQKQSVFRLSREQEYSHEQIASITGLSRSRVNNILVETMKHIRGYLDRHSAGSGLLFWLAAWDMFFSK